MNTSMITKQTYSDDRTRVKTGFTLVELLVAMAILGMIVLLMGRIFSDSSEAYKTGLKQSDQNLNGRVILDYLARELRQAIVDDNLKLIVKESDVDPYDLDEDFYEGLNDEVIFAAMGGRKREVELIRYYLSDKDREIGGVKTTNYRLMRVVRTNQVNEAYQDGILTTSIDSASGAQMTRNVSGFTVRLFKENGNPIPISKSESGVTTLPAYADVYLGLMGDSDLVEAQLKDNDSSKEKELRKFIHNREMVFMKRVYFRNRMGYNTGYGRDFYEASDD